MSLPILVYFQIFLTGMHNICSEVVIKDRPNVKQIVALRCDHVTKWPWQADDSASDQCIADLLLTVTVK